VKTPVRSNGTIWRDLPDDGLSWRCLAFALALRERSHAASRGGLSPCHSKTRVQKMEDAPVTAVTPAEIAGRTNYERWR
jgi:hypothetical protein